MIWSVSGSKQIVRCQRQWYYKNIVGKICVKNDPFRREVALLSKVKSIDAWRGTIVDHIISSKIIYGITQRFALKKSYYLSEALKEFNAQLWVVIMILKLWKF